MDKIKAIFDCGAGCIFVMAGDNVVGYRVASRLLKAEGHPTVRVGTRGDRSALDNLVTEGAVLTEFDWANQDTYANALEGVKTVFCTPPNDKGWDELFPLFLRACRKAGVKKIVKLSFYHALKSKTEEREHFGDDSPTTNPFHDIPLVHRHGLCDVDLMCSKFNYTLLFASHLMSNPLYYQGEHLRTEGRFYGHSNDKGVNYVSPNDVADVAVRALLNPKDHVKIGYTLTGPKAIKDDSVAELLCKHLNKAVMFIDQPYENFDKDTAALERVKASGFEEKANFATKDIENICNHPAQTFDEYLQDKDSMSPTELAAFAPHEAPIPAQ